MNPTPVSPRPFLLYADDDELNRVMLGEVATLGGFQCITVDNGQTALQEVASGRYDIVLLDVEMPGLDGYAVCRAIRSMPAIRHLPVVMITGNATHDCVERCYDAGATDFVAKPINWAALPHRLRYIVRNAESEQRLRDLAYRDELTGLPTRQALQERLTEWLERTDTVREPDALAVLQLDVGGFDRVEALGPVAREAAIRGIGGQLMQCLHGFARQEPRATLEVAHLEGDRFAVCVQARAASAVASRFADEILAAFEDAVLCGEYRCLLTPKLGLASYPAHGADAAALLQNAEAARLEANRGTGPALVTYDPGMRERSARRVLLEAELRRALRNDALTLHFQPKVRLVDDGLAGAEALLRWTHPEQGPISPAVFIPLAEESDLILEIGRWVLQAAARQVRAWNDAGLRTVVAVNVSARQFLHRDVAADITAAAAANGIEPTQLLVEITESLLMTDLPTVATGLTRVRALGCRVAVDDFGTGYSSLAYLKGLPVDEIKIDRRFIEHVDTDATDGIICSTILSLGSRLGLALTAEGIETEAQLGWLRERGCDQAQGFLLARPMPAADLLRRYGPAPTIARVA